MIDGVKHQLLARLGLTAFEENATVRCSAGSSSAHDAPHVVVALGGEHDRLELELWEDSPTEPAWKRAGGARVVYRPLRDGGSPLTHSTWGPVMSRIGAHLGETADVPPLVTVFRGVLRTAMVEPVSRPGLPPAARPFAALFHETTAHPADLEIFVAAWELGVFDALATSAKGATADDLAVALGASGPHLNVLVRALEALELVSLDGGGAYALTPAGAALQGQWRPAVSAMLEQRHRWHLLASKVRTGVGPAISEDAWRNLIHAFSAQAPEPSEGHAARFGAAGFGTVARLLDVGSGSGAYAESFLRAFPRMQVTLVDYPQALSVAEQRIQEEDLRARARFVAAAFYDEAWAPPEGHDGVWLANTLHVESEAANLSLLRRLHDALMPGGRIWVEERLRVAGSIVSCRNDLTWSLHAPRGRAYTVSEAIALLREAGFTKVRDLARDAGEALLVAVRS